MPDWSACSYRAQPIQSALLRGRKNQQRPRTCNLSTSLISSAGCKGLTLRIGERTSVMALSFVLASCTSKTLGLNNLDTVRRDMSHRSESSSADTLCKHYSS